MGAEARTRRDQLAVVGASPNQDAVTPAEQRVQSSCGQCDGFLWCVVLLKQHSTESIVSVPQHTLSLKISS